MVKKWSLSVLAMILLVLVAFVAWPENKPSIQQVRLAVALTPLSAPIYIADAQGYFRKCGLNVELIDAMGGKRAFQKVMDGEADFSTSSDSVATYQVGQGVEFNILASFATSENDVKILSHLPTLSADTSRPLRLGYWSNSSSEHLVRTYLQLQQLSGQVDIVDASQEELSRAFLAGELDAFSLWEPYIWTTLQQVPADQPTFLLPTEGLLSLHFMLLSSLKMRFEDAITEKMLAAIYLAIVDIYAKPDQAKAVVKSRLSIDSNFLDWVWGDYLFQLRSAVSLRFALLSNLRWLAEKDVQVSGQLEQSESLGDFKQLAKLWCQKT